MRYSQIAARRAGRKDLLPPSSTPPPRDPRFPGRCPRCRLPPSACFCAEIHPIATRTRVVVVRHTAEVNKTSNTGRLVAQALSNSILVDHGVPEHVLDLTDTLAEPAWVLAMGGAPPADPPVVGTLVVIDSSWSSAKGMRWRIPPLARLPTLTLPPPTVTPLRMRRGAVPEQMATIEAVAAALNLLGEPGPAEHLNRLFRTMSERLRALRGFDMPAKDHHGSRRGAR